jgi:hypothetical protein
VIASADLAVKSQAGGYSGSKVAAIHENAVLLLIVAKRRPDAPQFVILTLG